MSFGLPATPETELTPGVALAPADRRALRRAAQQVKDAIAARDAVIRTVAAKGGSSREIGAEVGLSHTWIRKIVAEGDDG